MFIFKRRNYKNIEDSASKSSIFNRSGLILVVSLVALSALILSIGVGIISSSSAGTGVLLLEAGAAVNNTIENTNISSPTTRVEIKYGKLEGTVLKSRLGRSYSAFYNIPYAAPPVGNLRFEAPQEYNDHWADTRDATKPGSKCMQTSISGEGSISGDEDCLYLSVYTSRILETLRPRKQDELELLPVMVYFLGGAFVKGHASIYGGEYFMDKDVIIVLPETRLGVLAFLTTGDAVISGNMGFKDQVMALRWVQENIAEFGGDPKKVTIFGNSSGAMSIHAHMVSNMSAGLFHRAISQSGVAILPPDGISKTAVEIGNHLQCPVVNDTRELVDCLKAANATQLLSFANKDITPLTVERISTESEVFLSDLPLNIMRDKKAHSKDIPWILGVNSDEFNVIAAELINVDYQDELNNNWENVAADLLNIDVDTNRNILRLIREFYFEDKMISNETRLNFTNMKNDRDVIYPTYVTARLQATLNMSNVYLYMLSKRPIKSLGSFLEDIYDPPFGVTHADEVQYLFPYLKFPYIGVDSVDFKMSDTMVDIWTRFASTGTPHECWKPFKAGRNVKNWFQLDDHLTMINYAEERMELWDQFPLNSLYASTLSE